MRGRYRYSKWDGRWTWSDFDAGELFDDLIDRMADSGDVQWGVDRLLWDGFQLRRGVKVPGVSEWLASLQAKRQELYDRYHLDAAFDEMRKRLQTLLEREKETIDRKLQQELSELQKRGEDDSLTREGREGIEKERLRRIHDADRRKDYLHHLPPTLSRAIETLEHYSFIDPEAQKEFNQLRGNLQGMKVLESFIDRYGKRFQGAEAADFVQAMEWVDFMKNLQSVEQSLQMGDVQSVSSESLSEILGSEASDWIEMLVRVTQVLEDYGYIQYSGRHLALTPKGIRRIGQKALNDIYASMKQDRLGGHGLHRQGKGSVLLETSRPYQYGDRFQLNYVQTFKNALLRSESAGTPIQLHENDFEVYESEQCVRSATALLLDMSWSMSWNDKFQAAKKVALALNHLIQTRFPQDDFHVVGFFTTAVELKSKDLPTLEINLGDPWTNLQDGLRLASKLLSRHRCANRQIVIVTDGQPTCYFKEGELHVEWPVMGVSPKASEETLREVQRCTQAGIQINTFMLDEEPALVAFVEELTRINKGRSFFTRPETLGQYLLIDYVQGKRRKLD